jgi:hypothetical protein
MTTSSKVYLRRTYCNKLRRYHIALPHVRTLVEEMLSTTNTHTTSCTTPDDSSAVCKLCVNAHVSTLDTIYLTSYNIRTTTVFIPANVRACVTSCTASNAKPMMWCSESEAHACTMWVTHRLCIEADTHAQLTTLRTVYLLTNHNDLCDAHVVTNSHSVTHYPCDVNTTQNTLVA